MPRGTNYALARRAVLRDLRRGVRSRNDVCDAHPELVRAARNVGERAGHQVPGVRRAATSTTCPTSTATGSSRRTAAVSRYPGELEKLRAKHDEFDRYVVEVCTDCRWNHLGARELHGRRHTG